MSRRQKDAYNQMNYILLNAPYNGVDIQYNNHYNPGCSKKSKFDK